MFDAMKYPYEGDTYFEISVLDDVIAKTMEENYPSSLLENCLVNTRTNEDEVDREELKGCLSFLNSLPSMKSLPTKFFEINAIESHSNSSTKESLKLKLK